MGSLVLKQVKLSVFSITSLSKIRAVESSIQVQNTANYILIGLFFKS